MTILSAKARQVISLAISRYGSPAQKAAWYAWASSHRQVRRAGDPLDDGKSALPSGLIAAILPALNAMKRAMADRRDTPGLSEDVVSDLDNDRSHLKSVEHHLQY